MEVIIEIRAGQVFGVYTNNVQDSMNITLINADSHCPNEQAKYKLNQGLIRSGYYRSVYHGDDEAADIDYCAESKMELWPTQGQSPQKNFEQGYFSAYLEMERFICELRTSQPHRAEILSALFEAFRAQQRQVIFDYLKALPCRGGVN